jgi:lipopolysaccharide export system protein LptC
MRDKQEHKDRLERLSASSDMRRNGKNLAGYSRFVKSLRIIFPLLALSLVIGLIVTSEKDQPALPVEEVKTPLFQDGDAVIEKNELTSPNFESETKAGKKYKITAARAVQELRQPDLIILEQPRATLETDKSPVTLSAQDGTYDQKSQFMTLNENILIEQEGTGVLRMKTLEADMKRGEMMSAHPVSAEGALGSFKAESFKATNDGMTIILNGPVTLTLKEGFETWFE